MPYIDFWGMLGYTNNAYMFMEVFGGSSNVILTDNPPFTIEDFKEVFPVFLFGEDAGQIPVPVFNLFKAMSDKSMKYDRYKTSWKYFMCLYIAHMLNLYLQTQGGEPGATTALQGALPKGIAQSKSVDSLSISYDFMGMENDLAGYGTWKLTAYGQQLATLTKVYGHAGMWANG